MPSRPRRTPLRVLTTAGLQFLPDLTDREATEVGRHWNALRRYLDFGDDAELAEFEQIEVGGYELETDVAAIEWHAVRGDVRFESIYHEFKTARKSFEDMRSRILQNPEFESRCRFRDSHGEEAIILYTASGWSSTLAAAARAVGSPATG